MTKGDFGAFAVFLIFIFAHANGQSDIQLSCPDGWSLYGSRCYKLYTQPMSWEDAAHTCRNYGGNLVRIFGYEENRAIGEIASGTSNTVSSYWIGLNRLGLDNPFDDSDDAAHWAGSRRDAPEASIFEGYWIQDQPEVRQGACARVVLDDEQYYMYGWEFMNCLSPQPFMCEARAGLEGFFRCANGRYIANTVCDGEDDCGDFSDEIDCPTETRCKFYITGTGGEVRWIGPYGTNKDCLWTIEGPVGSRVSLTFSSFNTEEVHDLVTILIGGKTESTSHILARKSGNLNTGELPRYYSNNNFMIVKFRTDTSVENGGFNFDWTADSQFPGEMTEVQSSPVPTEIRSLHYGQVLANTRQHVVIREQLERRVISLQVTELDLPEGAYVNIYDGEDFTAALLDTVSRENNPQSVISTGNTMSVYFHTGDRHALNNNGFKLTYKTGCEGSVTADSGYIVTPGYLNGINYPDYQECRWTVTSASNQKLYFAFRDPFGLQTDVDTLTIYDGTDSSGNRIGTFTGIFLPSSTGLEASTGTLHAVLNTSSVISARGFRFDFSIACPTPTFNENTILDPMIFDPVLDTVIRVSCRSGYAFAQEEHEGQAIVTMTCEPGGWDVRQTPRCEPLWCGQAPLLPNGFYRSFTGSTNGETLTYGCYDGFTLIGPNVITCQANGVWTAGPRCEASTCTALPASIANGNKGYTVGSQNEFGAIIAYECNPGYQLDGAASIICTEDGWSDVEPTCEKLQCPYDFFTSMIHNATFVPASGPVEVGDTVTVTCESGFQLNDQMFSVVLCNVNQTFSPGMPQCLDIDECLTNPCEGSCENIPGSYECTCEEGYEPVGNSCQDINECRVGGFGATYCSDGCVNLPSSYRCECSDPGQTLFTGDGTEGFLLFRNENGLVAGDGLFINHTCVRVQCPDLPALANGNILTTATRFNSGDEVTFFCDLGYVLNGVQSIQCQDNGQWTTDPSTFTCEPATCELPDISGLEYPPNFSPSTGPIQFMNIVNMWCTHRRPASVFPLGTLVGFRRCTFDYSDGTYKLFKQGESAECPIIDCKDPTPNLPSGAQIVPGTLTETYWQSTFTVECANLYTQEGETTEGNNEVICGDNGKWDYGTFQCNGAGCDDPGTPAGTRQIPEGTYEPGQLVNYECTQTGFSLSASTPLMCEIVGNSPQWNDSAPTCRDTTEPVLSQAENLCGSTLTIARLAAPDFTLPSALDNTGATDVDGLTMNLDASNNDPSIALLLDKVFSYTVTDFEGLQDTCAISVQVVDSAPPSVSCPVSFTYTVVGDNDVTVNTADVGAVPTSLLDVVLSPANFTVGPSRIGDYEIVTATVTDDIERTSTCKYMIVFEADSCSPYVLDNPENGVTSCSATSDGYSCSITCDQGYYLYDLSNDDTLVNTTSYSCSTGGSFSVSQVPNCVSTTRAVFYFRYELEYDTEAGAGSDNCITHYQQTIRTELEQANGVSDNLAQFCENNILNILTQQVDVVVTPITTGDNINLVFDGSTNKLHVNITFSITPNTLSDVALDGVCLALFTPLFTGFAPAVDSLKTFPAAEGCPALVSDTAYSEVVNFPGPLTGEFRCPVPGRKQIDSTDNHFCLPCPAGRYYNATLDQCLDCPVGEYQDRSGRTSCNACPPGTLTYSQGAASIAQCIATCNSGELAGFVSTTGLPPCTQCAKDSYASSEYTCTGCATSTATEGPGASDVSECTALCGIGFYSDTGFEPCTPCPLHFYQSLTGQQTCVECSSTRFTASTGSTGVSQCLPGETEVCTNANPCQNNGVCTFANHHAFCTCAAGYTGSRCETQINFCASNPCYYGKTCVEEVDGYSCVCGSGYTGDRCENNPDNCAASQCQNGGVCQDLEDSFVCLCRTGFTGTQCEQTEDICVAAPCQNGGTCRPITAQRRVCDCRVGYEGDDCSTNLDNCASFPCQFGTQCVDDGNSYQCLCPSGFSDQDCGVRADVCSQNGVCGASGVCVDDYTTNMVLCVCSEGFEEDAGSRAGLWVEDIERLTVNNSCAEINFCDPDPCVNSLGCTSTPQGPQCTCMNGYSGFTCQHDIDDCNPDPCSEFGECVDEVGGYRCECDPGFSGTNCEIEANDCIPYPCFALGTDTSQFDNGCLDKRDGFECSCYAGFAGADCGINLDECASDPCFHGADCEDGNNDYTCQCQRGWTGRRCDVVEEYCDPDPCENGSECLTVFGNYTCVCDFPFHGALCQNEADTCSDANPCIDPNSQCYTDDDGQAQCLCSRDYAGAGCHVSVDYCAHEDFCGSGGHCTPSLDAYTCDCGFDFFGVQCEMSTDDCASVACQGEGVCVDGIGDYLCQCPVGKQGPNCDKETDPDFDFEFYDEERTGAAYQDYPFSLGIVATEQFSVGMWVRYATPQGEGTFFTLYGLDDDKITARRRVLMQYDHEQIRLSFTPVALEEVNFGVYDINDGRWYYIMVTWVKATGQLEVRVNAVLVHTIELYARGDDLPRFGMVLLGTEIEEGSFRAERGSGFNGFVSHLYMWRIALDPLTEITTMSDSRNNLVQRDNLIVDWGYYVTERGVNVIRPSTAGDSVCDEGYTGVTCATRLPDKTAPTIVSCPRDVYVTSDSRVTQVEWEEPVFDDSVGAPSAVYSNRRVFIWGRYANWYVARDANDNAAICSFNIYVRNNDCPSTGNPTNGIEECSMDRNVDGDFWPFRYCRVFCRPQYAFSVPTPDFFTCGPQGSFNVDNFYLGFAYPACGPTTQKTETVTVHVTYRDIAACDGIQDVDGFGIRIYARLEILNFNWLSRSTALGGFCGNAACDAGVTVETVCSGTAGRRRRQTSDATVTITIPDVQDPLMNRDDNSIERTAAEILTQDILENGGFDLSDQIANAFPDETSLVIDSNPTCPEGQILVNSACVECGVGTFYDVDEESCELCPLGSYQDQTGQTACVSCGSGFTTELRGSQSVDDCAEEVCTPGTYYDDVLEQCVQCGYGFYQDTPNQYFCKPCDADKNTTSMGSDSVNDCFEVCEDGYQLVAGGACEICPLGTYRTRGIHADCVGCPAGNTTADEGSVTREECSVRECFAGTFINATLGCEPCPKGTFQPSDYETECIECGQSQTTLSTGSRFLSDCRFFCPMGFEDANQQGSCSECEVGFYKNDSQPGSLCVMCPDDFVTELPGSVSVDNCTELACEEGEEPNTAGDSCVACPRGSYQDMPYQDACVACPSDTTTRMNGSVSEDQCESFCPSGQEERSGQCEPCDIGYYRDNNVYEFGPCLICPDPDYVTLSNGSESVSACTIRNCSAGSYRDEVNNVCVPCDIAEYQDLPYQTSCNACPSQTTTDQQGSTSPDDCRLECDPGFEDLPGAAQVGEEECQLCRRGYYKGDFGVQACTPCGNGFITEYPGATSLANCTYADCQPGQIVSSSNNSQCEDCPTGYYTDRMWQTVCTPCDADETTIGDGADSANDCVTNCDSGYEYVFATRQCSPCAQGYYRTKDEHDVCLRCPEAFVTSREGAGIAAAACTTPNCSAGQFIDGTGCSPCGIGFYQPMKWQGFCLPCDDDRTTFSEGSTSESDCVLDCPAGQEYDSVTRACENCARGQYKGAGDTSCVDCPTNRTTVNAGSQSVSDCNIASCDRGSYAEGLDCEVCPVGTYQGLTGQATCISCPNGTFTVAAGSDSRDQCTSTDDCLSDDDNNCVPRADGGMCIDEPGFGQFSCACREGWTGTGYDGDCTHRCDEDPPYCEHGECIGSGSDVSCDCSGTNYEGARCQTRKESDNDTEILVGATVGGGVGLLLLILATVGICCYCFRSGEPYKTVPPQYPMVATAAPSVYTAFDGTLQSGIITKPATRYGGSTLGASALYINGDGASIAGFPSNQKYLIYDEGDDQPIAQNGYSNSVYNDSAYEERGSSLRFT